MRARSALILAKVIFEVREISLRNKPPSFLVYSSKGTVPVLVMPDQSVIDQSIDIMKWALQQSDAPNYLPEDEAGECDGLLNDGIDIELETSWGGGYIRMIETSHDFFCANYEKK